MHVANPQQLHLQHQQHGHLPPTGPLAARRRRLVRKQCLHHTATTGVSIEPVHELTFPHQPLLAMEDGRQLPPAQVIELLGPYVTPERLAKIRRIVSQRVYSVLPILENTYDMGNLAAAFRSADAFGLGAVHHVRRKDDKYKQSARTSAGAEKWLDVQVWDSTQQCVEAVKAAGLQLVVTHLSKSSVTVQEVDFTRPTAIVFGNEKFGASDEIVAAADACAIIPMAGFVESFNISVAFALTMYEIRQQRSRALGSTSGVMQGDLNEEQQEQLVATLMMRSVREPQTLIRELMQRPPPEWQQGRVKSLKARLKARQERLAAAGSS